jgi:hypothetical protein
MISHIEISKFDPRGRVIFCAYLAVSGGLVPPCSAHSTSSAFFSQNACASSRLSNPWNSIRLTCSPNLSNPVSYLANQRFVFISLSKFRYTK